MEAQGYIMNNEEQNNIQEEAFTPDEEYAAMSLIMNLFRRNVVPQHDFEVDKIICEKNIDFLADSCKM